MIEIFPYLKYFKRVVAVPKLILTKFPGLLSAIPVLIAFPVLSTPQRLALMLLGLFILDFITGIWASWEEFKKAAPIVPASGKRYLLQSAKLRMSGAKFVTYGLIIIVAYQLESLFINKEFEVHSSMQKVTLPIIAILFCCIVEVYSIVFENMKRIGFDIIQSVKNMAKNFWDIYKTIKNDKTD